MTDDQIWDVVKIIFTAIVSGVVGGIGGSLFTDWLTRRRFYPMRFKERQNEAYEALEECFLRIKQYTAPAAWNMDQGMMPDPKNAFHGNEQTELEEKAAAAERELENTIRIRPPLLSAAAIDLLSRYFAEKEYIRKNGSSASYFYVLDSAVGKYLQELLDLHEVDLGARCRTSWRWRRWRRQLSTALRIRYSMMRDDWQARRTIAKITGQRQRRNGSQ